ncbi:MAG: LacI family transcriptional regulator [Anaerolineae bacterium]|nr:LacI family transcriptional regulator [Anaerolineae bacterium]
MVQWKRFPETFPGAVLNNEVFVKNAEVFTLPITIHDVARRAGVGIGTVSSVINNSRPVNEATRQKVLAAVAELDFVPNPSGRRLSMGKTHTIGLAIPFFTTASQIERLRGVMSVIASSDYDINLFAIETVAQRNKVLQTVPRRGRVDGMLLFSLNPTDDDVRRISQENIPTVLVETAHPNLSYVYLDDVSGAQIAVQHLIELGHRKIAYISDYLDDPFGIFSRNRYAGYCRAHEAVGLPVRPEYHQQNEHSRENGRRMALEILNLPDPPTAIFAYSDELALGVLEAARELNLNVPKNLSVIGYDDIELAHYAGLTTIRQHLFESGVQGVEVLLDAIDNPETSLAQLQLPTELILRQTTAPPPAA